MYLQGKRVPQKWAGAIVFPVLLPKAQGRRPCRLAGRESRFSDHDLDRARIPPQTRRPDATWSLKLVRGEDKHRAVTPTVPMPAHLVLCHQLSGAV